MAGTSPSSHFLPEAGVCCLEPTQPFSFRTHFLPSNRKQKVTSPVWGEVGGLAGVQAGGRSTLAICPGA